jgi:hypothetical protein
VVCVKWQNGNNRFKQLRCRGVPKFNAAVAGLPKGRVSFLRRDADDGAKAAFHKRKRGGILLK